MSGARDLIVIGAGVNGLALAALAARAGRKVLVLEQLDQAGGLAASFEFHPGYRSAGLMADATGLRPGLVAELELERHGLKRLPRRPSVLALDAGGKGLLLHGDVAKAAAEIGAHSARDAASYPAYFEFLEKIRGVLADFIDRPPVDLIDIESASPLELARRGLRLRGLGKRTMMELLRLPPMCLGDWLDEWFELGPLKAAMALPALSSTWLGPRSPASTMNMLLWEASAGGSVTGGGPALVRALSKACEAAGVEIRTRAKVGNILAGSEGVRGVRLDGGEEIPAAIVAASCDPRTLVEKLLPRTSVSRRLRERIHSYRSRGTVSQLLVAVSGPVRFAARPEETIDAARTGAELLEIERAFDAVKYRRCSESPILEIRIPTATAPELAPQGHSVVSVMVHYTPHDLEGGWGEDARGRLESIVMSRLEKDLAGLAGSVVATRLISPADIEERFGLDGGHLHHGEHALDQLLIRPVPELAGYRSHLPGLYLCGSGSHPGGGPTGAPGMLAARSVLAAERR